MTGTGLCLMKVVLREAPLEPEATLSLQVTSLKEHSAFGYWRGNQATNEPLPHSSGLTYGEQHTDTIKAEYTGTQ